MQFAPWRASVVIAALATLTSARPGRIKLPSSPSGDELSTIFDCLGSATPAKSGAEVELVWMLIDAVSEV